MSPSRSFLSGALIWAGYVFYQSLTDVKKVAKILRKEKDRWTRARPKSHIVRRYYPELVAGCMHDMAGITEKTWSNAQEYYTYLGALFEKTQHKVDFWKEFLSISPENVNGKLDWG